jgi:predicted nucleotidyltransferase component of viral defense system
VTRPRFRLATADEAAWYSGKLYPLQDRIFEVVSDYKDSLVLTGGTALARLYFEHRYSEDVDLFTLQPQAGRLGRDLGNALVGAGFRVETVQATPDFFRALVSDGVTAVQVDVAPDSPPLVVPARTALGVFAHDLRDLAANKISAYENRAEVKDAADLFYLSQSRAWSAMFADADVKRVPIAYEDLQHFLQQPLTGEALLTREISDQQFDEFVATLHTEIAAEIKKKVRAATERIAEISSSLLWDTPPEDRTVNERTRPVLARRAKDLSLPQRIALLEALNR